MTYIYCARHDTAFIQETEVCIPCDKESEWLMEGQEEEVEE